MADAFFDTHVNSVSRKRMGMTTSKQDRRAKRKSLSANVDREYESSAICGLTVYLPKGFQPYPTQKLMMVKMLMSLKNKQNALIESPTGSGKTMALLSSSCAWLSKYKEDREASRKLCPRHGLIQTKSEDPNKTSQFNSTLKSDLKTDEKIEIKPELKCQPENSSDKENDDVSKMETNGLSLFYKEYDEDIIEIAPKAIKIGENNGNFEDSKSALIDISTLDEEKEYRFEDDLKNDSNNTINSDLNTTSSKYLCNCLPIVRIYYGTRTHKQITQVIKEFGRLPFGVQKNLKHTILASRDQSCVNPTVKSTSDITTHCKELLGGEGSGCRYRNELRKYEAPMRLRNFVAENEGDPVWDIEELVNTLSISKPPLCPYFASTRVFTIDADIIFTPFNYLLDPIIRSSSDVHLKNSIIILDEAHNVEDTSRDSASFFFTEKEIIALLENLHEKQSSLCHDIHTFIRKTAGDMDYETGNETDNQLILMEYQQALDKLFKFANVFSNWFRLEAGKAFNLPKNKFDNTISSTLKWEDLQASLEKANLLLVDGTEAYKTVKNAWLVVCGKSEKGTREQEKENSISPYKPNQYSIICVEKFLYFSHFFSAEENRPFYKLNVSIAPEEANKKQSHYYNSFNPKKIQKKALNEVEWLDPNKPKIMYPLLKQGMDVTINFWCMFPSVAFKDACKECHSVILASGTLCPTDTLKTELGLDFKFQMEGDQVISSDRIFATVVSQGPLGYPLNATYKNLTEGSPFVEELVGVITHTCRIVPKGVLCFFSSYKVLKLIKDYIIRNNMNDVDKLQKVIFEEPRRSNQLQELLNEYEDVIRSPKSYGNKCTGALMLAVFRGKISEGIDFADDKARCVICVGIPYPNFYDEMVIQKKNFNDQLCRSRKLLSGDEWYTTQAYRALNQALGRCLRHRLDWGAILLVDERFVQKANPKCADSKKISKWVRDQLLIYTNFDKLTMALQKFVDIRTDCNGSPKEIPENLAQKTLAKVPEIV